MEHEMTETWWAGQKGEPLTFPERLQVEQILQTMRLANLLKGDESSEPIVSVDVNTSKDPKGPFHMILPDPIPPEWVMEFLVFCERYAHFYDRGSIEGLPFAMWNSFEAGPPESGDEQ